jgi:hypothetical protein
LSKDAYRRYDVAWLSMPISFGAAIAPFTWAIPTISNSGLRAISKVKRAPIPRPAAPYR